MKRKRVIVVASALDISKELTLSWKWWSLLKGLWSEGAELVVVPFEGKSVETPWWRSVPRAELQAPFWRRYFTADVPRLDNWAALLQRLLHQYPDTHSVLYLGVPLAFFGPLARELADRTSVRQVYVDGEAAEYLERQEAATANLDSFAQVLTTQPGHEKVYLGLGAKKASIFPWWSDPEFFRPVDVTNAPFHMMVWGQNEEEVRPEWADALVFEPLRRHPSLKPVVVGGGFVWPNELQKRITHLDRPQAPEYAERASQALVHLNLIESVRHEQDGLAMGRLLDLACMGVCVVTHPFKGLDTLFKGQDELLVASSFAEADKLIMRAKRVKTWRAAVGEAARKRVIKHHTAQARAHTLFRHL